MRKFFGTSAASREPIPEAKRSAGVEGGEEFFAEYFNQALYETQVDYIIGTTTQVTNGTANVKIGAGSVFQDALGATVVFAQGDRIAIAGHDALDADLVFTANDLVFMMNPGVTIDQNSAYKTTISGLNCRGNLNFSNAFASSIVVGDTTSLLDIQTDLDGSVLAFGDVVINGNLYNDGNHENLLYGCYEVAQRGILFSGAATGYHLDGDYNVVTGTVTISQESSGAPIGSGNYVKYLYGSAGAKCDSRQALRSEIVETVKGKTITGSVLARANAAFVAAGTDLILHIQRNDAADTMTGGTGWVTIASTALDSANIPTGLTSIDWAIISCTIEIPDDGTINYDGLRWFVEPSAVGGSGEFFCLAQQQLHIGSIVRPYAPRLEADEIKNAIRHMERWTYDGARSPWLVGVARENGNADLQWTYSPKISSATITFDGVATNWNIYDGTTGQTLNVSNPGTVSYSDEQAALITFNYSSSPITAGKSVLSYPVAPGAYLQASAELT